jgi:protein-S-isoprenylcysteine O-methyltransferase Ste14
MMFVVDAGVEYALNGVKGGLMPERKFIRAIIGFALYTFLVPALLFICAGTLDWTMAWVYTILLLVSTLGSRLIAWRRNPDLLRERARFTESEGTKPWDRLLVLIVGLVGPMMTMVVAGLDQRFGWSAIVPVGGEILAALAVAFGYGIAVWAMAVNPFFSAVARIQREREQHVVMTGPYHFVRHPSYAGAVLASFALPFMLDALWTLVPALGMAAGIIIRTRLEDRMLLEELDGYQQYAQGTPYRLVPGIW